MGTVWTILIIFVDKEKIMNECYGRKYILNGELQPSETFDNSMVYEGESIYEVIRVIKGYPVFFHDHMERLEASVRLQNKTGLADAAQLRLDIMKLLKTDKRKEINLKLVFNYNEGKTGYLIYFIESIYPSDEQYRKGVRGVLFHAERKDPESKVINHKLRSSIYHKLILEGGYEALLVNEQGCITEGSRSNIFFIRGESLFTAPDSCVLNGITRKYIIDICRENDIKVEFMCFPADNIHNCDAVFMTGTSPMVLPFYSIGDHNYNVGLPVITRLRELYQKKADESTRLFMLNCDL